MEGPTKEDVEMNPEGDDKEMKEEVKGSEEIEPPVPYKATIDNKKFYEIGKINCEDGGNGNVYKAWNKDHSYIALKIAISRDKNENRYFDTSPAKQEEFEKEA